MIYNDPHIIKKFELKMKTLYSKIITSKCKTPHNTLPVWPSAKRTQMLKTKLKAEHIHTHTKRDLTSNSLKCSKKNARAARLACGHILPPRHGERKRNNKNKNWKVATRPRSHSLASRASRAYERQRASESASQPAQFSGLNTHEEKEKNKIGKRRKVAHLGRG